MIRSVAIDHRRYACSSLLHHSRASPGLTI